MPSKEKNRITTQRRRKLNSSSAAKQNPTKAARHEAPKILCCSEAARARQEEHERLSALPEVQAAVQEHLRRHFESWVDQEIPALGGRSPRDAMKDPDGREMVEALVLQAERHGRNMQPPMDKSIIRDLRARLGLA